MRPSRRALRAGLAAVAIAAASMLLAPSPAGARLDEGAWRQLLADLDAAVRSRQWRSVAELVRDAAADDSERAVDLVLQVGGRVDEYEVAIAAADALRAMASDEARGAIRRQATRHREWKMRLACLEAVDRMDDATGVPVLIEALNDHEDVCQRFAVRALTRRRTRDVVEPLIALMERVEQRDGRTGGLWADLKNSLGRLMGRDLSDAIAYRGYWTAHGAEIDPAQVAEPSRQAGAGGTVTLFGREIVCDRIVFILDISGSMLEADAAAGQWTGTTGRTRNNPGGPPAPQGVPVEFQRITRAKNELCNVLRHLRRDQQFNIIVYSTGVDSWPEHEQGLHAPTAGNVESATRWIQGLQANGTTATDTALRVAFERIEDADCFYLLSDGFATHDGTNRIPTEQILSLVAELNRFRQVQINTLGFEGADRDMMRQLAAATGGDYSDIR